MKKLFLLLFVITSLSIPSSAQEIYNAMLKSQKEIVNNGNSNLTLKKLAQFKVTALEYLKEKAFKSDKVITTKFMDDQAYYMNEFVNSFIQNVLVNQTLKKPDRKKRIMLYVDASGSNPLFKDTDKEVCDAYVTAGNQLTPFSLDTDWVKALAAVESEIEKLK